MDIISDIPSIWSRDVFRLLARKRKSLMNYKKKYLMIYDIGTFNIVNLVHIVAFLHIMTLLICIPTKNHSKVINRGKNAVKAWLN